MDTIITTLIWAAILQGSFLVGLYLFSKKHNSLANKILGAFLFIFIYEGVLEFIPYDSIGGYQLDYFSFPEIKLLYPVLFFHYVLEKLNRTKVYARFLWIHYRIAFAAMGVTLINLGYFFTRGQVLREAWGNQVLEIVFQTNQYYAFIIGCILWGIAIWELKRYKQIVTKAFSDQKMLEIQWLWQFVFAILPVLMLWGAELIRIVLGARSQWDFITEIWALVILFIYFVSYKAFQHKNLFEGLESFPDVSTSPLLKKSKPQTSLDPVISETEDVLLIEQLTSYMETDEPYLGASLSIQDLADQLNIPVRDLSLLINQKLNQHFFDFVNEYRIKKAMEILKDPDNRRVTVLEVLYEVGFNSKSSFNTVFKKYTGKTPTQYRKTVMN